MTFRWLSIAAVSIFFAFAPLASPRAAEDEAAELTEILVEEIPPLSKASAFATVINPNDYREQFTTLPELLARQPGIHVKGFGGLGQSATASIRGSTAEQVSVFLDGVRLNGSGRGVVDLSSVPLAGVERVEVLRGGASAQFGSDAIGGVINIVTKRPDAKRSLELKAGIGSFLDFETREGFRKSYRKFGFTLHHHHASSRGDFPFPATGLDLGDASFDGGEFRRWHNQFFRENLLTTWEVFPHRDMRLNFTQDFSYRWQNQPGAELETTLLYPKNPLDGHENSWRNTLGAQWSWRNFLVRDLEFALEPSYNLELNRFNDATPALGAPIATRYRSQSSGFKQRWNYEISEKNHRHRLSGLYEFAFHDFKSEAQSGSPERHRRQVHALFLQDEIKVLDDKLYFNPSLRVESASDFGASVAGHFGVVARPWESVAFKGNVENAFRYPNFNELYFPDQGFLRGNPDLAKESSLNWDFGVEAQHRWAKGEISYFRNDIADSILFVPISAFTIAPLNTGAALAQGLEASVALTPYEWWNLSGNYTWLRANFQGSGKQLPGRPRHLANVETNFSGKHFSAFARAQYLGALPLDFPNTRFLKARLLVGAGATYRFRERYSVTLEGKNLGDVHSADTVGFPLPGRSFYLSFQYKT